jgi:hypothetical protein
MDHRLYLDIFMSRLLAVLATFVLLSAEAQAFAISRPLANDEALLASRYEKAEELAVAGKSEKAAQVLTHAFIVAEQFSVDTAYLAEFYYKAGMLLASRGNTQVCAAATNFYDKAMEHGKGTYLETRIAQGKLSEQLSKCKTPNAP